ncbi:MAG: molybdopterin dinucleotide binding domain-containing protein, partial [Planctomycetota bacterium]
HYVQPHIGGDLALLIALAKQVLEDGAADEVFLAEHAAGWDALRQSLDAADWEYLVARSGIDRPTIREIAAVYAQSKASVFAWTMGITHHTHGVENVQAIGNLALLRGMVGRPGAGLMPIRGHSNVQGIGSVGVTPRLKQATFDALQERLGVRLPTAEGLDTMACMEGAAAGELDAAVCLGGNLYGSNPDAAFAEAALGSLEQVVYLSTTLNTGHARGLAKETIVLPVLARDEEPSPTTQESMFNYVRLSDGGPRRHDGPRSEVEVIADLAERVHARLNGQAATEQSEAQLDALDWPAMRDTGRIREAIAAVVPGWEKLARIDDTKEEFQIDGRTFHTPRFATDDGRARLHALTPPPLRGQAEGELRVMTIRSEGQFNTVVYEEHDLYRGVERRDVILMHPDDLSRFGLAEEDRVRLRGPAGEMRHVLARRHDAIRAGNAAMYYPEANALVGRDVDPKSRTPAFKGLVVTVERETATTPDPKKLSPAAG